ncbi:MAG TPA: hypothetical protein VIL97_05685 [Thermoanaerobaculia bacterium]
MRGLWLGIAAAAALSIAALAHDGKRDRDGYAVVIGETTHMSNLDLDAFLKVRKSTRGDFIWVRRGGASYRITDAALLRAAGAAMREYEPINAEQEALQVRMKPFEERESALDREVDALEARLDRAADRRAEREMRELERQMRELESKVRDVERELRALERLESEIDRRHEEAEDRVEAKFERLIDDAFRRGLAERL